MTRLQSAAFSMSPVSARHLDLLLLELRAELEHDVGAVDQHQLAPSHAQCDALAYALTGAGDHGDLVLESFAHLDMP